MLLIYKTNNDNTENKKSFIDSDKERNDGIEDLELVALNTSKVAIESIASV